MTKIDITKPLELSDGTPCRYVGVGVFGRDSLEVLVGNVQSRLFNADGTHVHGELLNLRNVKESEVRTSEECLQRMEALLRRMANAPTVPNELGVKTAAEHQSIAREIVAELDGLNGPQTDEEWARQIVGTHYPEMAPHYIGRRLMIANEAIAKGRELERLAIADRLAETGYYDASEAVRHG